jgi:hypothetical protein
VRLGGATWRCDLAVRLGGVPWPDVDPLRIDQCAPMGWHRSNARAVIRGSTWRSLTSTQFGGVSWRSGLAEWLGGVAWRHIPRLLLPKSMLGDRFNTGSSCDEKLATGFCRSLFRGATVSVRRIASEPLPRNPANSIGCRCPPSPRDFTPRASVHSPLPGRGLGSSRSPRRQSNCAARNLRIAFSILLPGATSPP